MQRKEKKCHEVNGKNIYSRRTQYETGKYQHYLVRADKEKGNMWIKF